MSMKQHFRSALFGGFNRRDVLTYIETTSRAHVQERTGLQEELEQVRKAAEAAEARATTAEAAVAELTPRAARTGDLLRELQNYTRELEAAKVEIRRLREQGAALTQKAGAYDKLKDQMATIELEAHQRAKQIIEEAERKAAATQGETERWVERVKSSYERLRADMGATLTHAAGELERSSRALSGADREFEEHDAAIRALTGEDGRTPAAPQS